jgi:hypothetical protein
MYRGAAASEDVEMAVVSVAQALAKVGGPDDQGRLRAAMGDPMTLPNVRERMRAVVTLPEESAASPDAGAGADAAAKPPAKKK